MRNLYFIICVLLYNTTSAIHLTNEQGGIAKIELEAKGEAPPTVYFQNNQVMVIKENSKWYAIVGIPITAKKGENSILVNDASGNKYTKRFTVKEKKYLTEYLTIKDNTKVTPPKSSFQRIVKERTEIKNLYSRWEEKNIQKLDFIMPAKGRNNNNFGYKRVLNGEPRSPHLGLDISAPQGTPVVAPKDGVVVKASDFYFSGNTVFLDHGQGLITSYSHLSSVSVKEGDVLKQGQEIGKIGMTGRVTGPHLHWSVSINKIKVDPNVFLN